jgi:hypothetical protein
MTPEGKVKKQIREYLDPLKPEVWYSMPVPTGFSDKGTPDFLVCFYGTFIAIETKAGRNKPTPLQERALKAIQTAHGVAMVINEKNIDESIQCLTLLAQQLKQKSLLANVSLSG